MPVHLREDSYPGLHGHAVLSVLFRCEQLRRLAPIWNPVEEESLGQLERGRLTVIQHDLKRYDIGVRMSVRQWTTLAGFGQPAEPPVDWFSGVCASPQLAEMIS